MRDYAERLGYPGTSSFRPLLWTLLVGFMLLGNGWASEFGGRVIIGLGLVFVGKYTADSWRKRRHPPVPPIGTVEWPAARG
jgi:hypothetical protein